MTKLDGSALEWLLSPLTVEEFLGDVWERKPYVVPRADREYFSGLFSLADLDAVLEFGRPRPPELRVLKSGITVPSDEYLQSDGRLDVNQLRRLYADGHTIVINGLDKLSAPVAELIQALQRRLNFRVSPNAYLTPRGAQGFNPHYDTHDVFIAQVGGSKVWRIYRLADICPPDGMFELDQSISRENLPEPRMVELSAGQLMYIPRGWIHDAETANESSLHLTIGIHPSRWYDLASKALTALALKHESLRRALPVGYLDDANAPATLADGLREIAKLLEGEELAIDAYSMLQDDFVRLSRPVPNGSFVAALDQLPSIHLETRLARQRHLYCRVLPSADGVAIQFARSIVRGPLAYGAAMTFIAQSHASFAVRDLPLLDDEQKISLTQRLLRDGLLGIVDARNAGLFYADTHDRNQASQRRSGGPGVGTASVPPSRTPVSLSCETIGQDASRPHATR